MYEFLYPTVRQYPFDVVCERIVRELEARNWQVPGVTVTFDTYGSGEQKMRLVRSVEGFECRLYFCRYQRLLSGGRWNDTAAVSHVAVGKQHLAVYDDFSGPTYQLYVGDNWEGERERFVRGWLYLDRDGGHDSVLSYTGGCFCEGDSMRHTHPQRLEPFLVSDVSRGGRKPHGDEPLRLPTLTVMKRLRGKLEKLLLAPILKHPVATARIDLFPEPEAIPYPEGLVGPLYTYGDGRDAHRVWTGQRNPADLLPADRLALDTTHNLQGGYRLEGFEPPEFAKEPSIWCPVSAVDLDSLDGDRAPKRPDAASYNDKDLFIVTPNRANDVYVIDQAAYEDARKARAATLRAAGSRRDLTDAEIAEWYAARIRTMVPITEYRGGYKEPIVLINRELGFDEVRHVGTVKDR